YRDLQDKKRDALLENFNESELVHMQDTAVRIMTQSNLAVAQAMQEVGVNAATDITGFGLLGHAGNVASLSCVDIVIDQVPVIQGALELAQFFGHELANGFGAETAGGMLVSVEPDKAQQFIDFLNVKKLPCWTLGRVEKSVGEPSARFVEGVEYIETEFP
ncbi:MAG: AIR synthase-related protein, partial [Candidatus Thorarchaeota archaeon]|nr:AIR synthase-related protein [Candidatus Thorarchaeota archaeon]